VLPLQTYLPWQYTEATNVLKVFATVGSTNFRWLELPQLDAPQRRSAGLENITPENVLEALPAAVTAESPQTRHLISAARPRAAWITEQVELRIRKAST